MLKDHITSAKDKQNIFKKPIFWVGLIAFFVIAASLGGGERNENTDRASTDNTKQISTPAAPATETSTPSPNTPVVPTATISQASAARKAKSYIAMGGFSHDGLIEQLKYEHFSDEDATYGADNSGADWNEQAAKKAKSYMDMSGFSRGSLITQLEYEKFTPEQAAYGATSVGL